MTLLRRIQTLGSSIGRAVWLIASRQYLSLLSAGVLALLAILVMTSDSFESRSSSSRQSAASDHAPSPPLSQPRLPRPSVLFYVVNDAAQRDEIAAAVHDDRDALAIGAEPDYILYLIAGTKEEESRTIARLNFEETAARQSGVDMRVIDLRGRFD